MLSLIGRTFQSSGERQVLVCCKDCKIGEGWSISDLGVVIFEGIAKDMEEKIKQIKGHDDSHRATKIDNQNGRYGL